MENNDFGSYIQVPLSERSISSELSGDFVLPDYQPEIKRLLKINAAVLPPSKYIGDSEAELTGAIDYYVLYTGSDNQLYCAPLSSEYKIAVPIDKRDDLRLLNMTADALIVPDTVSGRVTSPRKLSIKCRLKGDARIYGEMPLEQGGAYSGETGNQLLYSEERVTSNIFALGEMLYVSDEMILDRSGGETRVVNADGKVFLNDVTCTKGAVTCRGELYLKLLMCRESDGSTYTTLRRLPLSQSIDAESIDMNSEAYAKGSVCELRINVDEDRVSMDIGILIEAAICTENTVKYIKDAYSTTHSTDCKYKTLAVPSQGSPVNTNFTLSDSMTLDEIGITSEHSVIDTTGTVINESECFEDGKYKLQGKVRISLLLSRDGEYSCTDIEIPMKYTADGAAHSTSDEDMRSIMHGEIISTRIRIDGERIGVDCEVALCGNIWSVKDITMLDSISFGDEIDKMRGEYVICYPSRQDSLWSVAKRYSTTISSITVMNKIASSGSPDSDTSLNGVKYLIV